MKLFAKPQYDFGQEPVTPDEPNTLGILIRNAAAHGISYDIIKYLDKYKKLNPELTDEEVLAMVAISLAAVSPKEYKYMGKYPTEVIK